MDEMRSSFRVIEGGLTGEDLSSEVRLSRTKEEERSLHELEGWIFTSLGVLCFSLSFVSVRLALRGFDPLFIALARGAGAGTIAFAWALLGKYPVPARKQVLRLCLAAAGIVFAVPIFTTIALQSVPASHAATVSAILPLLTAVFGVWRKRERVRIAFWAIAAAATSVVGWYLMSRAGGIQLRQADILIIVACVACSYGYAEGVPLGPGDGWMACDLLDVGFFGASGLGFVCYLPDWSRTASSGRVCFGLVWSHLSNVGFSVYRVRLLLSGFSPGWCCPDEPDSTISICVSGTRCGFDLERTDRCPTLAGARVVVGSGGWGAVGDEEIADSR
jgi:drug/metabolite transporter (DMT)-like permease